MKISVVMINNNDEDVQNFIKQKKMEKLKQVRRHSSRARPLAGRIALVISLIKILETERKGAIISRDCEEEEENGVRNSLQSGPEARPESLFARVSCSIIVNFQLKGELCPPLKKYKMETSPLAEKSLRRWNSPHTSFLSLFSTLCFKFAPPPFVLDEASDIRPQFPLSVTRYCPLGVDSPQVTEVRPSDICVQASINIIS
ncbi:hypothetical protein J6590_020253 [Homalodisca vitripennis]|nr:hypothetical protein J6590_020253 [Homalodisca vitripennis]